MKSPDAELLSTVAMEFDLFNQMNSTLGKHKIPQHVREALFFVQQISGVPANLMAKILWNENRFKPDYDIVSNKQGGNGTAAGYTQFMRDSFYGDLMKYANADEDAPLAQRLIHALAPKDMPIAHTIYVGGSGNLRYAFLDPDDVESRPHLLASNDHKIMEWDLNEREEHSQQIYSAEDLDLLKSYFVEGSNDLVLSLALLSQRIITNMDKLKHFGMEPKEGYLYQMHLLGEGAGYKKARKCETNPDDPAYTIYAKSLKAAKANYFKEIFSPANLPYFAATNESGEIVRYKTIKESCAMIAEKKGFSNDAVELLPTDNALANGIREGAISIEMSVSPRYAELTKHIEETACKVNDLRDKLENKKGHKHRFAHGGEAASSHLTLALD